VTLKRNASQEQLMVSVLVVLNSFMTNLFMTNQAMISASLNILSKFQRANPYPLMATRTTKFRNSFLSHGLLNFQWSVIVWKLNVSLLIS